MKIGELEAKTEFALRDLYLGIEWNKLSRGEKLNLGRKFKEKVEKEAIPNVIVIESPKGKPTIYRKI